MLRPSLAAASPDAREHVVVFQSAGTTTQHATRAKTVREFLAERGIALRDGDYLRPSADTPLSDNLTVDYRAAVPVTLATATRTTTILTSAPDVGALLEEQHVDVGPYDEISPSLADPIVAGATIRIARVTRWTQTEHHTIAARTVHKIDFSLPPGTVKVIAAGSPGERDTMVRYTRVDYGRTQRSVLGSHVIRSPRARVVAEGVGAYLGVAGFAKRGLEKTSYIASTAIEMVATAYTASCDGCSGYTASGYRAGHGIVAVDPGFIPLGTHLYIPGYGVAIAGDTGGAIHGHRIDLGFDSISDALRFGRRTVTVYRLK